MRAALVLAVVLVAAASRASPAADGDARRDGDVRRDVQRALAQKDPRDRANGLDAALRDADSGAAASAVLDLVFEPDATQATLDAGSRALGRMVSAEALAAVSQAVSQAGSKPAAGSRRFTRILAAEALGRGTGAAGREILTAMTHADDVRVRAAAMTALGERREPESAVTFTRGLNDPEWTVRSAAIRGLRSLGDAKAVPDLADRMRRETGRLLDDLSAACADLTGRRFGPDPRAWEKFAGTTQGPEWTAPPPTFRTGLFETRSRAVLFVLATGETMKDPVHEAASDLDVTAELAKCGSDLADALSDAKTKMDVARAHLRGMLRTIADGAEFDVLSYAGSPTFGFGALTRADDAARRKAESRIAKVSPGGMPDVHEAVHRIFDPKAKDPFDAPDGPDTVVVLSDGTLPTNGFNDRTEIAPRAARWNRARQIRFVTVAVGQSDPYLLATLSGGPPPGVSVSVP